MENEQFEKLTEDIRKQLSRGNYQMDVDALPYTGQARNVATVLWEDGWRPADWDQKEDFARRVRLGTKIARDNIVYWIVELQKRHDQAKAEMVHEDDYQLGYLHGLTSAITFLDERVADIQKHDEWMLEILRGINNE